MDPRIWYFLGLLVGNLVRQFLPVARLIIYTEDFKWDNTYTRRFIVAIFLAVLTAEISMYRAIIPIGTALDIVITGAGLGLTENWLIEEAGKWEWDKATAVLRGGGST